MAKKNNKETIKGLQNDDDYVILSNPLASPKFIRTIGKGQNKKEVLVNDTYTPKVFYEIVSRLTPEHLEGIQRTETIKFDIQIKSFLQEIGANDKNYKYLIDSVEILRNTDLKWKDGDENFATSIITKSIHNEKTGKIEIYVDSDLAKNILKVKENANFSFLKSNVFRLQNAQAIKLYPFFKSWANYGKGYEVELERFKSDFGYNTSGYVRFAMFEARVLKPAIEEINEKTDIIVIYELIGENLESQRPRVRGLIFFIKSKEKLKQLATGERHEETPKPQDEPTHISNKIKDVPFVEIQDEPKQEPRKEQPKPQSITTPPPTGSSVPSEAEIQQLTEKLKLNPEQIQAIKNKLDNNIRVFEVLQGCINEIKAGNPIKSNIAYILGSIDTLGLGIYAQKQEKLQKEQERQIRENAQEQEQKRIKEIIKGYNSQSDKEFLKAFEELNEEQQAHYQRFIAKKLPYAVSHYYTKDNELNEQGKALAGQYDIFGDSYDRDNEILKYARSQGISLKRDLNKETKFALDGLITVETLTAEPQPQSIETAALTATAPSMATEPPHEEHDDSNKSRKQWEIYRVQILKK